MENEHQENVDVQQMEIKVENDAEVNEEIDLPPLSVNSFPDSSNDKMEIKCEERTVEETRRKSPRQSKRRRKGRKQYTPRPRRVNVTRNKIAQPSPKSTNPESEVASTSSANCTKAMDKDETTEEHSDEAQNNEAVDDLFNSEDEIDDDDDDEEESNGEVLGKRLQKEISLASYYHMKCHVCEEVCSSWTNLSVHCMDQHDTQAQVTCVCGRVMTCRRALMRHRLKHENATNFRCNECKKCFFNRAAMESHSISHWPKELWPFVCNECNRRFHNKSLLRHHQNIHRPVEERYKWICDICNKRFGTKNSLYVHKKHVHLGEKPFVCEVCGRAFAQKGVLQEHMTIHSEDKPFVCVHCKKGFKTKYRLKIHADIHREQPYQCPQCGLQLSSRRTLRNHLVVHKSDKPYQCPICGKAFRRSKDLKNHDRLHTGSRPYSCPFCPRDFANSANCCAHKRRMHAEEWKALRKTQAAARAAANSTTTAPTDSHVAPSMDQADASLCENSMAQAAIRTAVKEFVTSHEQAFGRGTLYNDDIVENISESELSRCVTSDQILSEPGSHFLENLLPSPHGTQESTMRQQIPVSYPNINNFMSPPSEKLMESNPTNLTIMTTPLVQSLLPSKQ